MITNIAYFSHTAILTYKHLKRHI